MVVRTGRGVVCVCVCVCGGEGGGGAFFLLLFSFLIDDVKTLQKLIYTSTAFKHTAYFAIQT